MRAGHAGAAGTDVFCERRLRILRGSDPGKMDCNGHRNSFFNALNGKCMRHEFIGGLQVEPAPAPSVFSASARPMFRLRPGRTALALKRKVEPASATNRLRYARAPECCPGGASCDTERGLRR